MGRSIGILSGKGGVGKTAVTASLAASLDSLGKSVVAVDADFGQRCLDMYLGLRDSVVYDLGDVIAGRCEITQAVVPHPRLPHTCLLAASAADRMPPSPHALSVAAACLCEVFDFVLIDAPAGIGPGFDAVAAACELPLVVTTFSRAAQRDAQRIPSLLPRGKASAARLALNRAVPRMIGRGEANDVDTVIDELHMRLIGLLPEEPRLDAWLNAGDGAMPYPPCGFTKAVDSMARRLIGQNEPLYRFWKE